MILGLQASGDCFHLLRVFEGLELTAYADAAGHQTIGYGHKILPGEDFSAGIDPVTAEELLHADVEIVEKGLNRAAGGLTLTQGQVDALCSFAFNLGVARLLQTTLWQRVQAGDMAGAAAEFPKWIFGGGKVLPGLEARRAAEAALFTKPAAGPAAQAPAPSPPAASA